MSFVSLLSFSFFLSCSSPKAAHDADIVAPDGDIPAADDAADMEADDFIFVEADEVLTDNDSGPDAVYCVVDENPDADIEYIPNTHTGNEDCPALASAKFPYYDTDGTIHFCRKCDQVRKNDPQCVRNQWIDANKQLCTDYPQYDCYDYPCDMPWLEPIYKEDPYYPGLHECDTSLSAKNPHNWDSGIHTFKHFNISDGNVGFYMGNAHTPSLTYRANRRLFEYSITNKQYRVRAAPAYSALTYHKGAFLAGLGNSATDYAAYVLYVNPTDDFRIVYNQPIRTITYTPVLTDKWVFANIQESDGAANKLSYAKVGEWKWTSLGYGTGNEPYIVGGRLIFYDDNFIGYYCDLDKSPQTLADCGKVNRDGEQIRFPVPDTEDNRLIYFETVTQHDRIIRLDLRGATPVYEEFPLQDIEPETYMIPIQNVRGNMLIYQNNFLITPSDPSYAGEGKLCFYRIDQKRSICMKPVEHVFDGKVLPIKYNFGYSDWDGGHFLAWQTTFFSNLIVRDMDCYCEKEGVCPFE